MRRAYSFVLGWIVCFFFSDISSAWCESVQIDWSASNHFIQEDRLLIREADHEEYEGALQSLERLGSRMKGFSWMVDDRDAGKPRPLKDVIARVCLEGLSSLGNPLDIGNRDVRSMLIHILNRLDKDSNQGIADRRFAELVGGFKNCQHVQYGVITRIYQRLIGKGSLERTIYWLFNSVKQHWLERTILFMEGSKITTSSLNESLYNSYFKSIGNTFGLSGMESAEADNGAIKIVDKKIAEEVYRSYVNTEELISYVYDYFHCKDEERCSELYRWLVDKEYDFNKVYDIEEGWLKDRCTIKEILIDMGILIPVREKVETQIIDRQSVLLDAFFPTTGYVDYKSYTDSLRQSSCDVVSRKLDSEEIAFVICQSQKIRSKILEQGMHNQFQSGSSAGLFDIVMRFGAERSHLGMTSEEYEGVPIEWRPKYGMVVQQDRIEVNPYGEDIWVLRKDRVRDRVTTTPGGPLSRYCIKCRSKRLDCMRGHAYEPGRWDDLFIPWGKRNLLTPYLSQGSFITKIPTFSKSPVITPSIGRLPTIVGCPGGGYMEFQVWGEVTPEEIDSFYFTKELPSREVLMKLAERGIKTYDFRGKDPLPYKREFYERDASGRCWRFTFNHDVLHQEEVPLHLYNLVGQSVFVLDLKRVISIWGVEQRGGVIWVKVLSSGVIQEIRLDQCCFQVDCCRPKDSFHDYCIDDNIWIRELNKVTAIHKIYADSTGSNFWLIFSGKEHSSRVYNIKCVRKIIPSSKQYRALDISSGRVGIVYHELDNHTVVMKVADNDFLYRPMSDICPRIEKGFSSDEENYFSGDRVYSSQRNKIGTIEAVFERGYVNVCYPEQGKNVYAIECMKDLHIERTDRTWNGRVFRKNHHVVHVPSKKEYVIKAFYGDFVKAKEAGLVSSLLGRNSKYLPLSELKIKRS